MVRVLPVVVHCSARPPFMLVLLCRYCVFVFWRLLVSQPGEDKPSPGPLNSDAFKRQPRHQPCSSSVSVAAASQWGYWFQEEAYIGSSPRKNGVQVCSTNFGGLAKLSDAESQRQHVRNPILADGAMHCTANSRCCSPITSCSESLIVLQAQARRLVHLRTATCKQYQTIRHFVHGRF